MTTWLYQLNQERWTPGVFRYEIWENRVWHWPYGQKRGQGEPEVGDTVVFFYAESAGSDPGIYGWAVVEKHHGESHTLYFIPTTPTNHLKMHPWWDDEIKSVTNDIRGAMKQATLFQVPDKMVSNIRNGIRNWLGFHPQ